MRRRRLPARCEPRHEDSLAERRPPAAARQGRQAAHVARDAPPRRAPRHHLSVVLRPARRPRSTGSACARCAAGSRPCRAPTPRKAPGSFMPSAAGYVLDPVPYARREISFRRIPQSAGVAAALRTLRCDRLRLPARRSSTCPDRLPCPAILFTHNVEAEIWRRHVENGTNPITRPLLAQQWRRMLRFEAQRTARVRPGAGRLRSGWRDVRSSLPRRAEAARSTSCRPASTPSISARSPREAIAAMRRRTSSSPARWTGCRTKTACSTSSARSCRGFVPRPTGRDAQHHRPRTRRRPSSGLPNEAGIEVTGRVDDVRPHVADGHRLHRAAAHRRRHAAQDFRSHVDGQSRRLHDHRRRRTSGHARPRHRHCRRSRAHSRRPLSA